MAEHLVLLVDSDRALSERTAAMLLPYGCRCLLLDDAAQLLAFDGAPSLIVFCIDPRKVGWTACMKLKKHPVLRSVPLILTSAEASEKDFDDHRRLKTRADEYERKPYPADRLSEKVRALLGGLEIQVSGEFAVPTSDEPGGAPISAGEFHFDDIINPDDGAFADSTRLTALAPMQDAQVAALAGVASRRAPSPPVEPAVELPSLPVDVMELDELRPAFDEPTVSPATPPVDLLSVRQDLDQEDNQKDNQKDKELAELKGALEEHRQRLADEERRRVSAEERLQAALRELDEARARAAAGGERDAGEIEIDGGEVSAETLAAITLRLQNAAAEARATLEDSEARFTRLSAEKEVDHQAALARAVEEREQRLAALDAENAALQEQILKAHHRLKSDETVVARAKKALSIALTLLDDSYPDDKKP